MRPETAFETDKKGNSRLTRDYKSYVRNLLGMNYEERVEWWLLGVPLTRARESRIVCLHETYDFLAAPINGDGNAS